MSDDGSKIKPISSTPASQPIQLSEKTEKLVAESSLPQIANLYSPKSTPSKSSISSSPKISPKASYKKPKISSSPQPTHLSEKTEKLVAESSLPQIAFHTPPKPSTSSIKKSAPKLQPPKLQVAVMKREITPPSPPLV